MLIIAQLLAIFTSIIPLLVAIQRGRVVSLDQAYQRTVDFASSVHFQDLWAAYFSPIQDDTTAPSFSALLTDPTTTTIGYQDLNYTDEVQIEATLIGADVLTNATETESTASPFLDKIHVLISFYRDLWKQLEIPSYLLLIADGVMRLMDDFSDFSMVLYLDRYTFAGAALPRTGKALREALVCVWRSSGIETVFSSFLMAVWLKLGLAIAYVVSLGLGYYVFVLLRDLAKTRNELEAVHLMAKRIDLHLSILQGDLDTKAKIIDVLNVENNKVVGTSSTQSRRLQTEIQTLRNQRTNDQSKATRAVATAGHLRKALTAVNASVHSHQKHIAELQHQLERANNGGGVLKTALKELHQELGTQKQLVDQKASRVTVLEQQQKGQKQELTEAYRTAETQQQRLSKMEVDLATASSGIETLREQTYYDRQNEEHKNIELRHRANSINKLEDRNVALENRLVQSQEQVQRNQQDLKRKDIVLQEQMKAQKGLQDRNMVLAKELAHSQVQAERKQQDLERKEIELQDQAKSTKELQDQNEALEKSLKEVKDQAEGNQQNLEQRDIKLQDQAISLEDLQKQNEALGKSLKEAKDQAEGNQQNLEQRDTQLQDQAISLEGLQNQNEALDRKFVQSQDREKGLLKELEKADEQHLKDLEDMGEEYELDREFWIKQSRDSEIKVKEVRESASQLEDRQFDLLKKMKDSDNDHEREVRRLIDSHKVETSAAEERIQQLEHLHKPIQDRQIHQEAPVNDHSNTYGDDNDESNTLATEPDAGHVSHLAVISDADEKIEQLENDLATTKRRRRRKRGGQNRAERRERITEAHTSENHSLGACTACGGPKRVPITDGRLVAARRRIESEMVPNSPSHEPDSTVARRAHTLEEHSPGACKSCGGPKPVEVTDSQLSAARETIEKRKASNGTLEEAEITKALIDGPGCVVDTLHSAAELLFEPEIVAEIVANAQNGENSEQDVEEEGTAVVKTKAKRRRQRKKGNKAQTQEQQEDVVQQDGETPPQSSTPRSSPPIFRPIPSFHTPTPPTTLSAWRPHQTSTPVAPSSLPPLFRPLNQVPPFAPRPSFQAPNHRGPYHPSKPAFFPPQFRPAPNASLAGPPIFPNPFSPNICGPFPPFHPSAPNTGHSFHPAPQAHSFSPINHTRFSPPNASFGNNAAPPPSQFNPHVHGPFQPSNPGFGVHGSPPPHHQTMIPNTPFHQSHFPPAHQGSPGFGSVQPARQFNPSAADFQPVQNLQSGGSSTSSPSL